MLIGLLAVDGMLALVISHKFAYPEGQRLPAYDQDTVELWIDQIKKADGYKVVLLGDSVIHGDAVASSFETLPAHVARELTGTTCPAGMCMYSTWAWPGRRQPRFICCWTPWREQGWTFLFATST